MEIGVIGEGNVGTHLHKAFTEKGVNAKIFSSRRLEGFRDEDFDVVLLAVADHALEEVAKKVSESFKKDSSRHPVVAHTAGSVGIDVLKPLFPSCGVFYPLQTFSKGIPLDYSRIPFFIEGRDERGVALLKEAASLISLLVFDADSETRTRLHVSAVFACNFVNHLWSIAADLLAEKGLDLSVLYPLIEETFRKIRGVHPADVQTGPAVRKDLNVIEKHLQALENKPLAASVYKAVTKSIMQ